MSIVTLAFLVCLLLGIPLGVLAAFNDRFEKGIRPVLDLMQTMPSFVYMVPIVMVLGIGNVPGVVVTAVFALPPVIRLTALGLREVPHSAVEAAYSFGSSRTEVLFKIQFPWAGQTIMAGINQTLMMALTMVTIASMISVDGLGMLVLQGIGRLNVGAAASGGIGIVLLAVILDRLTQAIGHDKRVKRQRFRKSPLGIMLSMYSYYQTRTQASGAIQ